MKFQKFQWKAFLLCLAVPLAIGLLSGFFIRDSVSLYDSMVKPPLAPPDWLFPIVWTLLYVLMGVSSYLILTSNADVSSKKSALTLYAIQLFLNFVWPLFFFQLQSYLASLVLLLSLWYFVFRMIRSFYSIRPLAGLLQIPYLLWLTFAAYLNLAVYMLNR